MAAVGNYTGVPNDLSDEVDKSGKSDKEGVIDHLKNGKLYKVKHAGMADSISFWILVVVTTFQLTWNVTTMAVRAAEENAQDSAFCLDDTELICKILPRDSRVFYDDLTTGVPLAPGGMLFTVVWCVLYFCILVHAGLHYWLTYGCECARIEAAKDFKLFNWAFHCLLIVYEITLALWPMTFAFNSLWLAAGMVVIAGCIIRAVALSASRDKSGNSENPMARMLYTETLVIQPAWLGLAALISLTLALKSNISTIAVGDDWAALWIAVYVMFACGLAFYTKTFSPFLVSFGSVLAILLRSIQTFDNPDLGIFDEGTNRMTDSFCIGSLIVIFLSMVVLIIHKARASN